MELVFGSMFFPLKMKEMKRKNHHDKIDLINSTLYEFSSRKMKKCMELPAVRALVTIYLDIHAD